MALIVKYKFQNVDANGNTISLVPIFPSDVSYTETDVVEDNITTRVIETDDLSKVTYIRFGCNENTYVAGAWEYLTEILDIDISHVNTFYRMFRGCKLLNTIDVSNWDTSNVTTMYYMFQNCSQLTQLDVSNWDTSKVVSMGSMFQSCSQLTQLDVSNWDTSNVTDMANMFYGCSQLTQLDVSKWNTSKVVSMGNMFYQCSKLTQLYVSKWDTSKVTNMSGMFQSCSQLTQLDVSDWDTSKVVSMGSMFYQCSKLTQLDLSKWDTSNVTNMGSMFYRCLQLTQLDVSNWDTNKVTDMGNMFNNCKVENVGLIYCSEDTINKLANRITSSCNFYVTNKTYTSPNPLVKYVMYREDKKQLLYYNNETQSWEKPVLREWDSIEKHSDGKYYYHKRSGEVVLDDKANIFTPSLIEGFLRYDIPLIANSSAGIICDKFIYDKTTVKEKITHINNSTIVILIDKSKLSTQDAQGFKAWLQANPTTVVYQLAEEKVYECANIDLITYSDKTSLMLESGAITPKTTLKNHQNITNITTILQEKVSVLENGNNTINSNINTINTDLIGVSESIEGSVISVDSKDGYLKDIEIIGNTIQNQDNLADIRSVGDKVEGQELYEIPVLSCGKNLFNPNILNGYGTFIDGVWDTDTLTQATPYEPYQGDKLTILSPVQLEKVGDVADRIICKDGVWGVEKNIGNYIFKGDEVSANQGAVGDIHLRYWYNAYDVLKNNKNTNNVIHTKIPYGIAGALNTGYEAIRFNNTGLNLLIDTKHSTMDEVNEFISGSKLMYILETPAFIPLPYDQQVKLRTFAGQTNIHFETEIEGTIKAQVPKSLGATVNSHTEQIGNLSKELDKIKKLEESTVSTVVTESDFTTVKETSNGYFEDVKLEGKTLVNLAKTLNLTNYNVNNGGSFLDNEFISVIDGKFSGFFQKDISMYKPNTTYTAIVNIKSNTTTVNIMSLSRLGTPFSIISESILIAEPQQTGIYVFPFVTKESIDDCLGFNIICNGSYTGQCTINNIVILEGDHTQNPPEYFEGLKSVGQDVEEITVLRANDNLVDYLDKSTLTENGVIVGDYLKQTSVNLTASAHYNVVKGKEYTFAFDIYSDAPANNLAYCVTYDTYYGASSNSKHISMGTGSINNRIVINFTAKEEYVNLILGTSLNVTVKNVSLNLGNTDGAYTLPKRDKKQILYYNNETQTWEKPILRQWDSIEKHSDGKYYYHKRSGEVVLNGSENWALSDRQFTNTMEFFKLNINTDGCKGSNYIADKFVYNRTAYSNNEDIECITNNSVIETEIVIIQINKSKLSTQDVEGFKAWLQANPTTVVYQLAEEKVYECIDLDLITYQNETNLLIRSGALNPKVSLKVSKGVGNVVKMLQNKVTMLEQMVYNLMKMLNTQQSNIDE